jgi:hypothetical protein
VTKNEAINKLRYALKLSSWHYHALHVVDHTSGHKADWETCNSENCSSDRELIAQTDPAKMEE